MDAEGSRARGRRQERGAGGRRPEQVVSIALLLLLRAPAAVSFLPLLTAPASFVVPRLATRLALQLHVRDRHPFLQRLAHVIDR
jgi:hypothetical protein